MARGVMRRIVEPTVRRFLACASRRLEHRIKNFPIRRCDGLLSPMFAIIDPFR
jgi:hypothetical protein